MRISSPTIVATRYRASAERQTSFTQEFAAASGEVSFTVPDGVFYISAVCVGGGGGGSATSTTNQESGAGGAGGGLHYGTFPVTPGETLLIKAGSGGASTTYSAGLSSQGGNGEDSYIKRSSEYILKASGGNGGFTPNNLANGNNGPIATCPTSGVASPKYDYYSEASYEGGDGGWCSYNNAGGGGGGAAGYSGNGGNGAYYNLAANSMVNSTPGSGGGGGGSGAINNFSSALTTISPVPYAGGVGVLGIGSNGAGGSSYPLSTTVLYGRPGSATTTADATGGGTAWGGGGSGPEDDAPQGGLEGLDGRVRVIFGTTDGDQPSRVYPSNAT